MSVHGFCSFRGSESSCSRGRFGPFSLVGSLMSGGRGTGTGFTDHVVSCFGGACGIRIPIPGVSKGALHVKFHPICRACISAIVRRLKNGDFHRATRRRLLSHFLGAIGPSY